MAEKVEAVLEVKVESDGAVRGANAVTQAMEGLNKAYSRTADLAGKAMKWGAWAKEQADFAGRTLQTKAAFDQLNVSMSRLERASGGQVSQLRLMEAANKSLRGSMGLTQKQFELTLVAADNLSDQGFGDQIEIQERLAQALKTGSGRALREFGITVDESKGKLAAHNAILKEYKGIAGNTTAEDVLSKGLDQFSARVENASVRLRTTIGGAATMTILWLDQLIAKLGLLEGEGEDREARLRRMAENQTDRELNSTAVGRAQTNKLLGYFGAAAPAVARSGFLQELVPGLGATVSYADSANRTQDIMTRGRHDYERRLAALQKDAAQQDSLWKTYEAKLEADAERRQKAALAELDAARWAAAAAERRKKLRGLLGYSPREGGDVIGGFIGGAMDTHRTIQERPGFGGYISKIGSAVAGFGDVVNDAADPRLEAAGKSIEDRANKLTAFEKKLADSSTAVGATYQMTQTLAMTSLNAIMEGNGRVLQSFRRTIGGQMKASALQNAAASIENIAKALGNPLAAAPYWAAAAAHGKAALAYTTGAAILGAGGGGGGGGSGGYSGASAASGFRPASTSSSGDQRPIIVNVNSYGQTPRDMGELIERGIRRAKTAGRGGASGAIEA